MNALPDIYLYSAAAALGLIGCYLLVRRGLQYFSAGRAIGHFVDWEQRGRMWKSFHPVIRFQAADEQVYDFVGKAGVIRKKARPHYFILYPPENPQAATIHRPLGFWLDPVAFFFLAGGMGTVALQ
jgi:hypothetical protein